MGGGGSSTDARGSGLAPLPGEDDEGACEDVRRIAGDREEGLPPAPCKELSEVLFCKTGVLERSLVLIELELGIRRMGVCCGCSEEPEPDIGPFEGCFFIGVERGEDSGRAVAAAVLSARCLKLSESSPLSLFVDFRASEVVLC